MFAIGRDGNIYSLLGGTLTYRVDSGMFGIVLTDKNAVVIGTIWYKLQAEYIIK